MKAAFEHPLLSIKPKHEQLQGSMRFARVNRPLTGKDLAEFRIQNGVRKRDAIFALGIPNFVNYTKICKTPGALPIEKELLIRLYDQYPRHVAWRTIQPKQLFEMLYGDLMAKFVGTEHETPARLALYTRIMACFGRSPSTAYRWFEGPELGENDSGGRAKVEILMLMNLLSTMENPREVFEALARQTLACRGLDLETRFPLPDPSNPPPVRKPGRKPNPNSKKAQRLAAAQAGGTQAGVSVTKQTGAAKQVRRVKAQPKGGEDATQTIAKEMKKAGRKRAATATKGAQPKQNAGSTKPATKKPGSSSTRAKAKAKNVAA